MSHHTLMLAAHASAAVPDMQVVKTSALSLPGVDSALAWDADGQVWIIELPQSDEAESKQRDRIAGATAIGDGLRTRLPFAAPRVVGTTEVDGRTLSVGQFLPGSRIRPEKISPDLSHAIGAAVATLHDIPASALYDQGRPVNSATDAMRKATSIVDKAAQTTLLPKALLRRWEAAYEDHDLWQFEPTIIHGALHLGAFLAEGSEIVAVTGWRELSVGDPARDVAWFTTSHLAKALEPAKTSYLDTRPSADRRLFQRARFWAELDIARWLLHGIDIRSEQIVDDATKLIEQLHERISGDLDQTLTEPITQTPHPLSDSDSDNT
jgi:aminoglycoside phosphotransferase (APT) family kinase protein